MTFLSVTSSDLISKWVGESEKLIAELFALARQRRPSIIFCDEIDGLCAARDSSGGGGDSSSTRTINQFLTQLSGLSGKDADGILFVGATNLPWVLDQGMRRRFQRRIYVPLPEYAARCRLFALLAPGLSATQHGQLASMTDGLSGSDIDTLVQVRRSRAWTHSR